MKRRLFTPFVLLLFVVGCVKNDINSSGSQRISSILEENKAGWRITYAFSYNANGMGSEVEIFERSLPFASKYLYTHTQNTSTRRYLNEKGIVTDIDSTIINAADKPVARYQSRNKNWVLQQRFEYGTDRLLKNIVVPVNVDPDSFYYFTCQHENGNLVKVENANGSLLGDDVYTYYPDKPSAPGSVFMLEVLLGRGRVLVPYTHLPRSYRSSNGGVETQYEYANWKDGRVATLQTIVNGVTESTKRITYEK